MTGHQASPSSPQFMQDHPQKTISISDMIKTYQLESITYLDGYNTKSMQNSFYNAFAKKGINLIIVSAECALNKSHRLKDEDKSMKPSREFTIAETCVKCNECFEKLGCTAIEMVNDKLEIQEDRCMAEFCDVCYNVCPNHAIFKTVINPHLESQKIESNQKSEDKKG
jgi:TPP-dependent indolepyruvate ferredoxin oxidoreductase alpha subunit